MKQILLFISSLVFLLSPTILFSQHSGSYVTLSGGMGSSGFQYDLEDMDGFGRSGVRRNKFGWQVHAGYSYYFNRHLGVGATLGVSRYKTLGRLPGEFSKTLYTTLGEYQYIDDDDGSGETRDYELRVRLQDWHEEQRGLYFEIPVMGLFQHKFDPDQRHGIYAGVGVKFQFPLTAKYKVKDANYASNGRLNVSGYYMDDHVEFGNPEDKTVHYHGFGTIHNPYETLGWGGKLSTKMSIAATAEVGLLIGMSPRVDLTMGGYIDYGLNNIKKGGNDTPLLEAPDEYHTGANYHVGNGIRYNGMINSSRTGDVKLLSYGGKIGVRVKLGKLPDLPTEDDAPIKRIKLSDSEQEILKERIFFELNSSELDFKAQEVLDRKVQLMERYPELTILILGNTCNLGNSQINAALGLRRANSAKRYMMGKGISEDRLSTMTQSSDDPLAANDSDEHRAVNRRADFDVDRR